MLSTTAVNTVRPISLPRFSYYEHPGADNPMFDKTLGQTNEVLGREMGCIAKRPVHDQSPSDKIGVGKRGRVWQVHPHTDARAWVNSVSEVRVS